MENWYYVKQGERQGPVTQAQMNDLVTAGEIAPDSLVWNDTMENWEPASNHFAISASTSAPQADDSQAPASGENHVAPPLSGNTCSECGMVFSEGELSVFGGKPTCQRCLNQLEQQARAKASQRSQSASTRRPATPAQGQNTLAVTGFIMSLASVLCCCGILAIPGLICSYMGYKQSVEKEDSSKGLAIAGIVISIVGIGMFILGIIIQILGAFAEQL